LRAATALLKRERRQSLRVAVQAAVSIRIDESNTVEGILLDLSTGGMDVLAAKPLPIRGSGSRLLRASRRRRSALKATRKLPGAQPTVKPACAFSTWTPDARAK
jgi:c-di-GMP-binding flagellar brake protein YcgR